jgi:hypothetical protein
VLGRCSGSAVTCEWRSITFITDGGMPSVFVKNNSRNSVRAELVRRLVV